MHIQTSNQPELCLGFRHYTCNWGTHICGLYETEAERDEIVLGYLHQGDIDSDLQLYCPCERTEEDFRRTYAKNFPAESSHLDNGDIFQLYSAESLYFPNGNFSPWEVDDGLNAFYQKSQKNGPRNIRATAEMVWALNTIPGVEHLMAYESRLNYFIPGKPWISICLYNVSKFTGSTIIALLKTHPVVINGGVITINPYYIDPDTWLAKFDPQFLNKNKRK